MAAAAELNVEKVSEFVETAWSDSVIDTLSKYIEIPNQSPLFDPEWATNGYQEQAVELLVDWVKTKSSLAGLTLEVITEEGRTPLIYMEVPAFGEGATDETVLLYGHLDKQPPLTEFWDEGLHPLKPVIRDGKLYGRGGADDGYSIFAAVSALGALQEQGVPHSRCVITIEACEESGSRDLPHYISKLKERIGEISLVVCLDSGCGNYEQLWLTSSLRGIAVGTLKVGVLTEGVHSGASSGIVPDSFRVLSQLVGRIEDPESGVMAHPALQSEIPALRLKQAEEAAATLGDEVWNLFPWAGDMQPAGTSNADRLLAKTWKPALSVTGVEGMPDLVSAGNVLRPYTAVKLSVRLPPTCNSTKAVAALKQVLEKDPPYNAPVSFECDKFANGWEAPAMVDWLEQAASAASKHFFGGKPHQYIGEGGSIPFMGMLGEQFPKAQFVITGVLGPQSNAHGPNEFCHIQMSANVTKCVAYLVHAFSHRK